MMPSYQHHILLSLLSVLHSNILLQEAPQQEQNIEKIIQVVRYFSSNSQWVSVDEELAIVNDIASFFITLGTLAPACQIPLPATGSTVARFSLLTPFCQDLLQRYRTGYQALRLCYAPESPLLLRDDEGPT